MTPEAGPIRLVVIQPTPYCNIDCAYCYLTNRDDRRRMSMDVVCAIGRNVLSSPLADAAATVVWHAGEPTVMGPAWYDQAFRVLQDHAPGGRIRHSFQTNAIAIDDRWIDLWRRWGVRVGVSIDGPRRLNDLNRRTRRGRGAFDPAISGLRRLREAGLPFHVITVLTEASLDAADELFAFYRAEGVSYVCFNVEEKEGLHRESSLERPDAAVAYMRFLRRFALNMRLDPGELRCREIDGLVGLVAGTPESRAQNSQARPLEIVSIGVEGGMSTFSPELLGVGSTRYNDFAFGNVLEDDVSAILRHPAFIRLWADIREGIDACARSCAYFGLCGGGAPGNKYFENKDFRSTETLYCRLTRKAVIDAILPILEENHEEGD